MNFDYTSAEPLEAKRMRAFYQASTWFREIGHPQGIAQALVKFAAELLDTARATVFVLDQSSFVVSGSISDTISDTHDNSESNPPKALYPIADLGAGKAKARILSNQKCLIWQALNSRQAIRVENDLLEPSILYPEGIPEQPVSLLLIPIQTLEGEQLGVLRVSREHPFSSEESTLLEAAIEAAAYVWIKLQRQWHEGILARATTLSMTNQDLKILVHTFGDLILEVAGGNCALNIWGDLDGRNEEQYHLLYTSQVSSEHTQILTIPDLKNHTDLNHTDLNHTDLNHTDLNHTDLNHTDLNHITKQLHPSRINFNHQYITVEADPLFTTSQQTIAIDGFATLELNSPISRFWLSWRLELCHTLAHMLSNLLKKSLEEKLRIRHEEALNALLRIKEQPQTHGNSLNIVLQLLAQTIGVSCVYLTRLVESGVEVLACYGECLQPGMIFKFEGSTLEQMVDQVHPVWLERHTLPYADPLPAQNVYLGIPLLNNDHRSITALMVSSGQSFPLLERDFLILIMEIFAVRLSSELRDAENNARLEATVQAHQILRSALTLQEVYQRTVDAAAAQSGNLNIILLLHQPLTNTLDMIASASQNQESDLGYKNSKGEGRLCWQVFETRQTTYIPDASVLDDSHYWSENRARAAYLGVPLLDANGNVFGVLSMDTNLDRGDIRLQYRYYLEALAQAAGSAIGRLKALETAEQESARFQKLAELSIHLEGLTDPQAIAQSALETLIELTDFEAGSMMIRVGGNLVRHQLLVGPHPQSYMDNFADHDFNIGTGLLAVSLKARALVLQSDYPNWQDAILGIEILSVALMPIFRGESFYGMLALRSFNHQVLDTPNTRTLLEAIAYRVERAIERSENLNQLRQTRSDALLAMGLMLEHRDLETKGHTERVTHIALEMGNALCLPIDQLEQLRWGAYLHDVGKVAIPDRVLLKAGKLDLEEWQVMQNHAILGEEMLSKLDFIPSPVLKIVRHHHERWDGSGYPEGLKQDQIPLLARVFSIADVFDALISERPYKRAWTSEEALSEIRRQAGFQFDPELVELFLECNTQHAASAD